MRSKIEKLVKEVESYNEDLSLRDNIESRLQKTLDNYLYRLDRANEGIISKKITTIYKELNK